MTHIPQPIAPINPAGLEEVMEELLKAPQPLSQGTPPALSKPSSYLMLPQTTAHPDIYIPLERSHDNELWEHTNCTSTRKQIHV